MTEESDRARVLSLAPQFQGIPYRLPPDPEGIESIDCSLFVLKVFRAAGLPFPAKVRTAEQLRQACVKLDAWADVRPGDLLFCENTYESDEPRGLDDRLATHVGISLGVNTFQMWDAHERSTDPASAVGLTDIRTSYWQDVLFEARRPRQFLPGPTGSRFRTTNPNVRLRAGAGTSQEILIPSLGSSTVVRAYDEPLVAADGYEWRHVRVPDGTDGWVANALLELVEDGGEALSATPDHVFTFAELWPAIQAAAAKYRADPQLIAAIIAQESSFRNWRVHLDGTGHGLFGYDDGGLLPDLEAWSGQTFGRGHAAASIPPGIQIEFAAKKLAEFTARYGGGLNAARVWHRGPGGWDDELGDNYEALIRGHLARLFG